MLRTSRRNRCAENEMNQRTLDRIGDPETQARIAQYEMAYRMQHSVPELTDVSDEPKSTFDLYGDDAKKPGTYAYNVLMARRLSERGVRFVQLFHRGWDAHGGLPGQMKARCGQTDQASAALIQDLKQRGLLDETLVVWGGEFGRTPLGENRNNSKNVTGRDHHPNAFSIFMAGGGSRGGYTHGETDEIGWNAVVDPVHVNDFQATLMKQFGLNHKKLTFRHQGADKRLTNITREAEVIEELIG